MCFSSPVHVESAGSHHNLTAKIHFHASCSSAYTPKAEPTWQLLTAHVLPQQPHEELRVLHSKCSWLLQFGQHNLLLLAHWGRCAFKSLQTLTCKMIWINWVWLLYSFLKKQSLGAHKGQLLMWWLITGFAEMFIQQLNKYVVVNLSSQFPGPHIFTLPLPEFKRDRKVCNFWGSRTEKYSRH